MIKPADISIADYQYNLPEEKIAFSPLQQRDASKLLVYRDSSIQDDLYKNISAYIPSGSLMVFNDTKVVQARLIFQNSNGASIELFCLEPSGENSEINTAMQQTGKVQWKCFVRGLKKWKEEFIRKTLQVSGKSVEIVAKKISVSGDAQIIEISWTPSEFSFSEILLMAGQVPLPPYIKREAALPDKERYQTVYAQYDGSVAAPTAGLHFTPELIAKLKQQQVSTAYVTLHVGAGTFKPVKAEKLGDHEMHTEQIVVSKSFLQQLLNYAGQGVIAVGTTSLRTLESLYWLGNKLAKNPETDLTVEQWMPYETSDLLSPESSIKTLIQYLEHQQQEELIAKTGLLIMPGYEFKIVNTLITNFHQPGSTLLLLVAAFTNQQWKNIYDHALRNDYRFLSYGDGSILFRT